MRIDSRTAPVQGSRRGHQQIAGGRIPWALHELAWRAYAAAGHGSQSAERMAERGGFDWVELIACLRGDYNGGIEQAGNDLFEEVLL